MVISKEQFPVLKELVESEAWVVVRHLARERRELLAQRVLGSPELSVVEEANAKGEWRAWGQLVEDIEGLVRRNRNE